MESFIIQIYFAGVLARFEVQGLKMLEAERQILAGLVGETWVREAASLPITDPGRDHCELTREQFSEYSNQRVELRAQGK